MDKQRALEELKMLASTSDPEVAHGEADDILLALIDDPEITEAFENVPRWYA